MKQVTLEQIKKDLETAVYVERLMPPVRPPKYRCWLFEIVYTPQEIAFMERHPIRPRPTQEQIGIWEMVILRWLPILDVDERSIVWKRSSHIPWKLLCRSTGLSRQALHRTYLIGLAKIFGFVNKGKRGKKM
jgi:hypothetical protein